MEVAQNGVRCTLCAFVGSRAKRSATHPLRFCGKSRKTECDAPFALLWEVAQNGVRRTLCAFVGSRAKRSAAHPLRFCGKSRKTECDAPFALLWELAQNGVRCTLCAFRGARAKRSAALEHARQRSEARRRSFGTEGVGRLDGVARRHLVRIQRAACAQDGDQQRRGDRTGGIHGGGHRGRVHRGRQAEACPTFPMQVPPNASYILEADEL